MALFGNLSDVPEMSAVEPGEYDCRIVAAKDYETRYSFCVEVVGEDYCPDFWYTLWLPKEDDTVKQRAMTNANIKKFLENLGVDEDIDDLQDFVGVEFSAELGTEADYKNPAMQVNNIKNIT